MNIPENIRHMTVENAMRSLGVKLPRRCEHIMSNGQFCGSPALRGRNYCYFHLTHIGRQICAERAYERLSTAGGDSPDAPFSLPALEDANSVQIGLMQVMDAILHNRLDSKRAGLLLYGLQTASSNLANGADFSVPSGEATVGGYDAFEQDYELDDDVPELKVDENDAAEEYEEEEDEEEEEEEGQDGEEEEEGEDGEGEDGELDEDDLEDSDEAESEDEQDSAEAEAESEDEQDSAEAEAPPESFITGDGEESDDAAEKPERLMHRRFRYDSSGAKRCTVDPSSGPSFEEIFGADFDHDNDPRSYCSPMDQMFCSWIGPRSMGHSSSQPARRSFREGRSQRIVRCSRSASVPRKPPAGTLPDSSAAADQEEVAG